MEGFSVVFLHQKSRVPTSVRVSPADAAPEAEPALDSQLSKLI